MPGKARLGFDQRWKRRHRRGKEGKAVSELQLRKRPEPAEVPGVQKDCPEGGDSKKEKYTASLKN